MYGNGYSMAIVLDHRSTATSLTGNQHTVIKSAAQSMCKLKAGEHKTVQQFINIKSTNIQQ